MLTEIPKVLIQNRDI